MIYDVEITGISFMDDFEGVITISLSDEELHAFYLAPYDFAQEYLHVGDTIKADLWLLDGRAKIIPVPIKEIVDGQKVSNGFIRGKVKKCFSSYEFRVDCGPFEIDIINEESLKLLEGEYIETKGTYQIFLPGTDYNKESTWG